MAHDLCVPHLSYDELRGIAADFLRRHHPAGSIPVPIEEIIEIRLHLDVIPTPGLQTVFDVDAFITSDMESIFVDEFIYQSRHGRYRFSLAHEIAHAVLHQKTYRSLSFDSIDSWKKAQERIPDEQYGWLEWQGYAFAGLVLVPESALKQLFDSARSRAEAAGVPFLNANDAVRRRVSGSLADEFDVSTEVVERRIAKDELWPT